jgi:hypothetical protein
MALGVTEVTGRGGGGANEHIVREGTGRNKSVYIAFMHVVEGEKDRVFGGSGGGGARSRVGRGSGGNDGGRAGTDGDGARVEAKEWRDEAQRNGHLAVERWRGRGMQQWELRQVSTSSCTVADGNWEQEGGGQEGGQTIHEGARPNTQWGQTIQLHALVSWQAGSHMDDQLTQSAAEAAAWRYPR